VSRVGASFILGGVRHQQPSHASRNSKTEWVNPHAWLHIDVKDEDGKTVAWMIETAAPNALLGRGYTKNSLPIGAEILVEDFRAKDRSNRANGSDHYVR
jgi:hypothetical protein